MKQNLRVEFDQYFKPFNSDALTLIKKKKDMKNNPLIRRHNTLLKEKPIFLNKLIMQYHKTIFN